jgi:hypothetical protein
MTSLKYDSNSQMNHWIMLLISDRFFNTTIMFNRESNNYKCQLLNEEELIENLSPHIYEIWGEMSLFEILAFSIFIS